MESNGATSLSRAIEHHETTLYNRLPTSPRSIGHPHRQSNQSYFNYENSYGYDDGIMGEADDDSLMDFLFPYATPQMLFEIISSKDDVTRLARLVSLHKVIIGWAKNKLSSKRRSLNQVRFETDESLNQDFSEQNNEDLICPMQQAIANLLRISVQCPYSYIREKCHDILKELKEMKIDIPKIEKDISKFIPNNEIHSVDTDDEQAYSLYIDSFIRNCRLENMVMILGLHPQYLDPFLRFHYSLLSSQGMLSCNMRSYIALMAASRQKCPYLVRLLKDHFLLQGGDKEWLKGINHAPAKLQILANLNKLLAHRPWLVTSEHIKGLMEHRNGAQWQPQELALAIVLLCHFHSLAIFCLGTGINLEIDHFVVDVFTEAKKSAPATPVATPSSIFGEESQNKDATSDVDDIEILMERMKKLDEEDEEEVTREEMNRRFEKEKEEALQVHFAYGATPNNSEECFSPYIDDPDFGYKEFSVGDEISDLPTFRAQDYTWDDHASAMLRRYYDEDFADILDDKFNIASTLTYHTLGRKDNVDTTSLRRAIWKYVQCMYGIMHDDYNYGEINHLIEAPLKLFIKTVSCHPDRTDKQLYKGFWRQFRHSEKVQVCIMVMEARLQVGLLYGMRAFTQALR